MAVSVSNRFGMKALLPPKLCTCGSSESGSTASASRRSSAIAGIGWAIVRIVAANISVALAIIGAAPAIVSAFEINSPALAIIGAALATISALAIIGAAL